MKSQTFSTKTLRNMALFGYFGLLLFMPLWLLLLSPSEGLSPTLSILMFVAPLLFPLKGMLQGNPYTYAWANFVVMIYFLHSLTTLWVGDGERLYAVIELFFATIMFFAGSYYSKYRGQELGLKIKKLKQELEEEKQQNS
ncbi:DUF2069 domain-containing protein [Thalassomonas sp. M1454]|uniref:DUF2069 domain-containing protein n=1 Tax=Thalassomonas sp. M1454 TaxID=2594477 RepID=UPI00117BE195|nr:DUF2069 domain-containing protein [Thalassomonas sp. M1454]TRX56993.1 DUF2069 domain-containing protein [Thalassomonas sp. M1454]